MHLLKLTMITGMLAAKTVFSSVPDSFPQPFYMGLALGAQNATAQSDRYDHTNLSSTNAKLAGYSSQTSIIAGYGNIVIPHIYLGLETKFDWSQVKLKFTFNNHDPALASLRIKETVGLAGRLGLLFHKDSVVYIKIGLAATNMKLAILEGDQRNSTSKRLYGTEIALGLTVPVTERLFLSTEVAHTRYPELKCSIEEYADYRLRPRTNIVSLRLIYAW